jgi:hypothetical protein
MNVLKSKLAASIGSAYFLSAMLAVIFAFGKYPDNPILFYVAIVLALPWSVVAVLSSMLLIHISSDPLDTQLMRLMIIGVLINAAIIYLLTAWLEGRYKSRLRAS